MTFLQYYKKYTKKLLASTIALFCFAFLGLQAQVPKFSFTLKQVCAPTEVTFYNESIIDTSWTYIWDFGKAEGVTFSKALELKNTYSEPKEYFVSLSIINGANDTTTTTKSFTLLESPTAITTYDKTTGCIPLEVTFSDASTPGAGTITEYRWDFGNGKTQVSNSNTASTTYQDPGEFSVYYEVIDDNGCKHGFPYDKIIDVRENPVANFTSDQRFACDTPLFVNFTNTSDFDGTLQTSEWDFGDGNTASTRDASNYYNSEGHFNVSLTVTDGMGCSDLVVKNNYINIGTSSGEVVAISQGSQILADSGIVCPGAITFTSTLSPQSDYKWQISYTGNSFTIDKGASINTNLPNTAGLVTVSLFYGETNGCPDSISKVFIVDNIKADFELSEDTTCQLPTNLTLTNQSVNAISYRWVFPDYSASSSANEQYTIEKPDDFYYEYTHVLQKLNYTFSLEATSSNGCKSTISKNVFANPPLAHITPNITEGCIPLPVEITNKSLSDDPIVEWKYIFENESGAIDEIVKSNNSAVNYTFTNSGIYDVKAVVTNELGCIDTSYSTLIRAGDTLTPDFDVTPSPVCYGDELYFTLNNSLPGPPACISYASPDIFATACSVDGDQHIILKPDTVGLFPVTATVNINGCYTYHTIPDAFEIQGPAGNFYDDFDCDSPLYYQFYADLKEYDNFEWSIGDSVFYNKDTVSYRFPSTGDYKVTLSATNSSTGCIFTKSRFIFVRIPVAILNVSSIVCLGMETYFDASASREYIDTCNYEGFLWKWGDGTPDRRNFDPKPQHTYVDTGTFYPVLEITSINGCTDTDTAEIKVTKPFPEISISDTFGCGPNFKVTLTYDNVDESIYNWQWRYSSSQISAPTTDTVVQHTYTNNISYTYEPGIIVTDEYGCTGNTSVNFELITPETGFTPWPSGLCTNKEFRVIPYSGDRDSLLIDYDDGTITHNTLHQFTEPGEYYVTLTAWYKGCVDSSIIEKAVSVDEVNPFFAISKETAECYPDSIQFYFDPAGQHIKDIRWDFDDGTPIIRSQTTPKHTYTKPGTFNSNIYVESTFGCWDTLTQTIKVFGPSAEFTFSPDSICSGEFVDFRILNIKDTEEFTWYFGDGETSTNTDPVTHQYFAKGTILPSLGLKSGTCEPPPITDKKLEVSLIEADFDLSISDGNYCLGGRLATINNSTAAAQSQWFINNLPFAQIRDIEDFPLAVPGEFNLMLVAKDQANCSDTASKIYSVQAVPEFEISGDGYICEGTSTSLGINGYTTGWDVVWAPAEIMNNPNSPEPVAIIDSTVLIVATVTNELGCSVDHTFLIKIDKDYQISRIPLGDTSIFLGQSIQFITAINKDSVDIKWTPNKYISCTDCLDPVIRPMENITYTLTTTDNCGTKTEEFFIEVIRDFYLEFPKAFTPNADQHNDIFVYASHNIGEVDFKIFNRWGNLIFETERVDEGWDGTINGQEQNADTYTFYIRAKTIHGYEFERKGTFLLLR